jgi:hypothetical protein
MSEETPKDYAEQAETRVATQYRHSTKLLAAFAALAEPIQNIDDTLRLIPPLDDIELATGVNLTVTAQLVGQPRELAQPSGAIATDTVLRLLAKARITRNHSHATGPDILNILFAVFASPIIFHDYGGMHIGYAIARAVTADEAGILNGGLGGTILARPMGVMVTQQFFIPGAYFGFDDTPSALPFGELNQPAPPGGRLSEIF